MMDKKKSVPGARPHRVGAVAMLVAASVSAAPVLSTAAQSPSATAVAGAKGSGLRAQDARPLGCQDLPPDRQLARFANSDKNHSVRYRFKEAGMDRLEINCAMNDIDDYVKIYTHHKNDRDVAGWFVLYDQLGYTPGVQGYIAWAINEPTTEAWKKSHEDAGITAKDRAFHRKAVVDYLGSGSDPSQTSGAVEILNDRPLSELAQTASPLGPQADAPPSVALAPGAWKWVRGQDLMAGLSVDRLFTPFVQEMLQQRVQLQWEGNDGRKISDGWRRIVEETGEGPLSNLTVQALNGAGAVGTGQLSIKAPVTAQINPEVLLTLSGRHRGTKAVHDALAWGINHPGKTSYYPEEEVRAYFSKQENVDAYFGVAKDGTPYFDQEWVNAYMRDEVLELIPEDLRPPAVTAKLNGGTPTTTVPDPNKDNLLAELDGEVVNLPDYMDQAVLDRVGMGDLLRVGPGVYTFENLKGGATIGQSNLRGMYDGMIMYDRIAQAQGIGNTGRSISQTGPGISGNDEGIPDKTGNATSRFNLWILGFGVTPRYSDLTLKIPSDITAVVGLPQDKTPYTGPFPIEPAADGTQFASIRISRSASVGDAFAFAVKQAKRARTAYDGGGADAVLLSELESEGIRLGIKTVEAWLPFQLRAEAHLDATWVWDNKNAMKEMHLTARLEGNAGDQLIGTVDKFLKFQRWVRQNEPWGAQARARQTMDEIAAQRIEELYQEIRVNAGEIQPVQSATAISRSQAADITPGTVTAPSRWVLPQALRGLVNFQSTPDGGVQSDVELADFDALAGDGPLGADANTERYLQQAIQQAVDAAIRNANINPRNLPERGVQFTISAASVWAFANANLQAGVRLQSNGDPNLLLAAGIDSGVAMAFTPTFNIDAGPLKNLAIKAVWVNGEREFARWNGDDTGDDNPPPLDPLGRKGNPGGK